MARRCVQSFLRHSVEPFCRIPSPILPTPSTSPLAIALCRSPWMHSTVCHYAKRRSKFANDPYAWIKVGENEPCPSSQPNKGSVKNRNQKKRMAQRDAFIKEEAQKRIAQCKAAKQKKLEAQKKRWKEGAARARAWKEKKEAEAKEAEAKLAEAQAQLCMSAA